MVINAPSHNCFFLPEALIIIMASGLLILLVIPSIIALVFGAWVLYSVMLDISQREDSAFTVIGPDRVRANIEPGR